MMQFEALIANDYRALLDTAKRLSPSAQKFYAPHFIVETSEWQKASKRIMFVGQETRGWGWYANEQPLDVTLGEASHRSDALTLLIESYRRFGFARDFAGLTNSPLWKFFHLLDSRPEQTLLWNNLIKISAPTELTDGKSNSLLKCSKDLEVEVLNWQRGILLREIRILQPIHIVFVTGPYYDHFLIDALGDIRFEEIPDSGFCVRAAAIMRSSEIGVPMIRIYHPGYSRRARLFDRLLTATQTFIDRNAP